VFSDAKRLLQHYPRQSRNESRCCRMTTHLGRQAAS
jgi:hypothetical protein